jgi:predicted hotdog family 3-hydroxylacyl-ACP dehydratase
MAHPLRDGAGLPAICGVEYATQAMAVHGALKSGSASSSGLLAALRDVTLHVQRLDELEEDIVVVARRLLDQDGRLLYGFDLRAGAQELVRGRATVILKRTPK